MAGQVILVSGGAASGKSAIAEQLTACFGGRTAYVATMATEAGDRDAAARVERHRLLRQGRDFETQEIPCDLAGRSGILAEYDTLLIECMSNLLANEMYLRQQSGEVAAELITRDLQLLARYSNLVIVTNEAFSDGVRYDEFSQDYLQALGVINQRLAAEAQTVIEVVAGIVIEHKGCIPADLEGVTAIAHNL